MDVVHAAEVTANDHDLVAQRAHGGIVRRTIRQDLRQGHARDRAGRPGVADRAHTIGGDALAAEAPGYGGRVDARRPRCEQRAQCVARGATRQVGRQVQLRRDLVTPDAAVLVGRQIGKSDADTKSVLGNESR